MARRLKKRGVRRLEELLALLRSPEGCPWDREQTHESLRTYVLEEACEVIDAIAENHTEHLVEELGDLLLQVVFHAQLGRERKEFDLDSIAEKEVQKMVERHPHVFGDVSVKNAGEVTRNWEQIKQQKQPAAQKELVEHPPSHLPALLGALRLGEKASHHGFDWEHVNQVWRKFSEEVEEFRDACDAQDKKAMERELGDMLFTLCQVSRHLKLNPETALRGSNKKFTERVQRVGRIARDKNVSLKRATPKTLDRLWNEAKGLETRNSPERKR